MTKRQSDNPTDPVLPTFRTKVAIWHTGEQREVPAGEVITLPHLAEFQIKALVDMGVVEPIEDAPSPRDAPESEV